MKSFITGIFLLLCGSLNLMSQELTPYIKVTESRESIQALSERVIDALQQNALEILGTYQPGNKKSLKVIASTRNDLKNTAVKVADRGDIEDTL